MKHKTISSVMLVSIILQTMSKVNSGSGSMITKRQTSPQSQYYLAFCPVRQGNYITYTGGYCYCRRDQPSDCRPAGNGGSNAATQRPPVSKPVQAATIPPLRPPPVAPPPPPPPNRPSTPPNVDTRPGVPKQLLPLWNTLLRIAPMSDTL